jgi:8-oxo-dGTP pyrophosphatase MutT (NUDIX family)
LQPTEQSPISHLQSRINRRGAMAVVLTDDWKKVLLLRREIFILWDLPGGGIEKNEEPSDAAVRECQEETGIEIVVDQFVGCYQHQSVYGRGDQLTYAYRAHAVGGKPKRFGLETTGLEWRDVNNLPRGFERLHRQIIADAITSASEPFERYIAFSLWKLYLARVMFTILRYANEAIRHGMKAIRTLRSK